MKKKSQNSILFFLLLFFLNNCSSIQFVSKTAYKSKPSKEIDQIYMLSQLDSVAPNMQLIGTFKMKENSSCQWDSIHKKLKIVAYENDGNIIKLDEYHMARGYGTKGNAGYLRGRLYYSDKMTDFYKEKDSTFLYISRYEKDNFLATQIDLDLEVNGKLIGPINNLTYYKIPVKPGDELTLKVKDQKTLFDVLIHEKKDYYVGLRKYVGPSSMPIAPAGRIGLNVGIKIGEAYFYDMNRIEGKLEVENIMQLKIFNKIQKKK